MSWSNPQAVIDELHVCFGLPLPVLRGSVNEETYTRIGACFRAWEREVDRASEIFSRYRRHVANGCEPERTARKLARANLRVDDAERQLYRQLSLPWPEHLRTPRPPLEPRSAAYFVACLKDETQRLSASA